MCSSLLFSSVLELFYGRSTRYQKAVPGLEQDVETVVLGIVLWSTCVCLSFRQNSMGVGEPGSELGCLSLDTGSAASGNIADLSGSRCLYL